GVMVPRLRNHDQTGKAGIWHHAKVTNAHANAGQSEMESLIEMIEELEEEAFRPTRPLGEDDLTAVLSLKCCEESRNIARQVFAVTIHDHGDGIRVRLEDVDHPHGNRSLVAEIPAQPQHHDFSEPVKPSGAELRVRV